MLFRSDAANTPAPISANPDNPLLVPSAVPVMADGILLLLMLELLRIVLNIPGEAFVTFELMRNVGKLLVLLKFCKDITGPVLVTVFIKSNTAVLLVTPAPA